MKWGFPRLKFWSENLSSSITLYYTITKEPNRVFWYAESWSLWVSSVIGFSVGSLMIDFCLGLSVIGTALFRVLSCSVRFRFHSDRVFFRFLCDRFLFRILRDRVLFKPSWIGSSSSSSDIDSSHESSVLFSQYLAIFLSKCATTFLSKTDVLL